MAGQDNETIVTLIQSGQGNRNELLTELWKNNIGLVRKIIHQLTGLDRKRDRQDFGSKTLENQGFPGFSYDKNR